MNELQAFKCVVGIFLVGIAALFLFLSTVSLSFIALYFIILGIFGMLAGLGFFLSAVLWSEY